MDPDLPFSIISIFSIYSALISIMISILDFIYMDNKRQVIFMFLHE